MKKPTVLSQPERLVTVSASAMTKPLSKKHQGQLERLAAMPDPQIDFSDSPEMFREHFKPIKKPIAMRIDSDVLAWLRSKPGYQTKVNQILRDAMVASQK